jgi:hypothetical protein
MAASYTVSGDSFHAEKPRLLSDSRFSPRIIGRSFDLHPDGDRFALASASGADVSAKRTQVTLIFNFFDELKRITR